MDLDIYKWYVLLSTTYGFEEGDAISTDVSRWGETETADQTSSKIGEDITVKVGHDEHVVLGGILDDLNKKLTPNKDQVILTRRQTVSR